MFDLTKPVETRDGRKARIICEDRKSGQGGYPYVVLVADTEGREYPEVYTEEGKFQIENDEENDLDLVNIPTHKWINVYTYSMADNTKTVDYYDSEQSAMDNANEDDPQLLVLAQKVELYDNPF